MTSSSDAPSSDWPGQRLGLPESGPRSVARIGRRIAAIAIDWAIAVAISAAFFSYDSIATLLIFVGLQVLFTIVINTVLLMLTSSIGQSLNLGLSVDGFWTAVLGSIVISIVSVIMSVIFRDELKGRKG